MVLRAAGGANGRAPLGPSSGGGSSTCMCWALLCSAGDGAAPKSTYREPGILFWIILSSVNMPYVLVSSEVAILKCSGAARIKVPAWLSHATIGALPCPFSTAMTFAGPRYPLSPFFFPRRK